jgi:hypothetical protein
MNNVKYVKVDIIQKVNIVYHVQAIAWIVRIIIHNNIVGNVKLDIKLMTRKM